MRQAELDHLRQVEARSAGFRKELGLRDLVLTQIVYVVGSAWVGTAALLGNKHIAFWLLAIALYYLPQAAVVIFLSRSMPIEGGPYQWARAGLGEFVGFLTAWNLWAYSIVIIATFGVVIATNLSYFAGDGREALVAHWWYTPSVSVLMLIGITVMSVLGLRFGKWVQSVGGAAHVLAFAALILVPFIALHRGVLDSYHPLDAAPPEFQWRSLNIFGKLALGALSGFEYVAILAGECRSPARTIGRSVVLAVPIIAAMFILGTSSTLALVPEGRIDLVSPIPQTLTIGFQGLGFAVLIVPVLIVFVLLRQLGTVSLLFSGNSRLPMVAGWDGLLPGWFTRLHPRFRTPINSIVFVGVITLALSLAGQVGVGVQEAFQLLENAAGILYAFTYLALFAIPLFGARRLPEPPPMWLRVAAGAGFAVSLLYSVLSIFPIIDVSSWKVFAAKILIVLFATQLVGVALYAAGRRRRRR